MKILDLFSGIGGFSLAAHWMGWETVGFVEWDKYNQKVLTKNFSGVPIHGDITTYHGTIHEADIITGGFPCQPFSTAGKREGTNDSRYLWPEMLRVIREVQPTYVIGENVAGIYSMDDGRVFEQVCTDLEDEGYAVQPFRIPACATGAPHRRDRWWFVAYAREKGLEGRKLNRTLDAGLTGKQALGSTPQLHKVVATTHPLRQRGRKNTKRGLDLDGAILEEAGRNESSELSPALCPNGFESGGYRNEPWPQVSARLCRVDDGLPAWVDRHRTNRLKSLGNSIQPQVAYQIFKALTPCPKTYSAKTPHSPRPKTSATPAPATKTVPGRSTP